MGENNKIYDLIIIGAGPAGLSASVYASRYGIKHIVLGEILGGQISETHLIDNYLGLEDMSGFDFAQKLGSHAKKYGTEIISKKVKNIVKENNIFKIGLAGEEIIKTNNILLATGVQKRKLDIPDEEKYLGKGLSYCATCDGFFYKNKTVAVVGGNDSAAGAAVFLGDIAKKVFIIYRKGELRAEKHWQEQIKKNPKIEIIYNTVIESLEGGTILEKINLLQDGEKSSELKTDGLFVEIGAEPDLSFVQSLKLETDEEGYVKINSDGETSIKNVWAAGDITTGSGKFCQVITAASEGAIAARSIFDRLKKRP